MAVSPIYAGSNHIPLALTWTKDDGTPVDLTGATITARYSPVPLVTGSAGTGTVAYTDRANGKFTYTFSSGDIATAGTYTWQFTATYGDSTKELHDPITIQVIAAI